MEEDRNMVRIGLLIMRSISDAAEWLLMQNSRKEAEYGDREGES